MHKRDWTEKLAALPAGQRRAMTFLQRHLPASDRDCYPFALFLRFAEHALLLRETTPWCKALDWEIFCHYVLFPRVNDEDLRFHSRLFYEQLWPRVSALDSEEEMALEVNRWCHERASYEMQDERTASPLTVYRCGSGRCGEESAFLVAALRSVGLPARQVYVPRWSHCDDNHAWVEVLCGGRWRFLGACEPEPVLDRGWFNAAAAQAMLVRSRLFGEGSSPLHGEPISREGKVRWYNQTARYAPVRRYTFRALREGRPAPGAVFQLQILNEAFFYTIATLTADETGEAELSLGLGSLHVLAAWEGWRAEGDCVGGELTLHVKPPSDDLALQELDFHPPLPPAAEADSLTTGQKSRRAETLRRGNALREERLNGFFQARWLGSPWEDLLRKARGNSREIAAFLERDDDPRREKLLRTLTEKDLRDAAAELLEAHLTRLPPQGTLPEAVYWPFVACPRIALEPLSPWRGVLSDSLPREKRETIQADPAALWAALEKRVKTETEESYAQLFWTPAEALAAGRCDEKSRKLLLVALLRDLGVPARLRRLDGEPEVWRDGAFQALLPEKSGFLSLRCPEEAPPKVRQAWSLSRRTAEDWQLLELSDEGWEKGARTIKLPAGRYRWIRTVRLPAGNQLAVWEERTVSAGECCEGALHARSYETKALLYRRELPPLQAMTAGGEAVADVFRVSGGPALLLWLEPGREPTEHLLHELLAAGERLKARSVNISVLLREREGLRHPGLAALRALLPAVRVLLADGADTEPVARRLNCDPEQLPLAVLLDKSGQARFAAAGYRVGMAELLLRLAGHIGEK